MTDSPAVPVFQEYMNPMLEVLRGQSGAVSIEELERRVLELMKIPNAVRAVPHDADKPDRSEVGYRMAWARTYLKKAELLVNPERGRWGISSKGRGAGTIDAYTIAEQIGQSYERAAATDQPSEDREAVADTDEELETARVGEELERQLRDVHARLAVEGELLGTDTVSRCLRRFRDLFGPDVLSALDGEPLLQKVHGRGNKDSLVYWLEFKDDEEFPARFGSISGGSALKFGIYRAADTGNWMTGSGRQQLVLSLDAAVAKVREQRDQLLAGVRVLETLPESAESVDYRALQSRMEVAAPDLVESSWAHKYLSLLFPNIIEPFHGAEYQAHQLYKLLKRPAPGRYENDRIFAGVAKQLGVSLLDLAETLYRRNGAPHGYWRIGTTVDDKSEWPRMREGGFAAIGWSEMGNLEKIERSQEGKQALRALLDEKYPGPGAVVTKAANQIFQFLGGAHERDIVLAMEGAKVRGIGRITGPYFFDGQDGPCPHRRRVEWLSAADWKAPEQEGLLTTFVPIRKAANIIDTEARLLGAVMKPATPSVAEPAKSKAPLLPLTGMIARVDSVLRRKRQVILYGPPGTGKTYWAERAVVELAARSWFGVEAAGLDEAQRRELADGGAIGMCSFHPAYGYEDFLEGFRPIQNKGALSFELRDGIFKKLSARASSHPTRSYYLIIDEINRGDIPRIFGELLTVLEREKRGTSITLPLSGQPFAVPDNVFVVGTMNTADRSIALLDAALRRRFGFVELVPNSSIFAGVSVAGIPLGPWLEELNRRVVAHAGRDARHLQVGHSYLMPGGNPVRDLPRFVEILRDDIIPLLEEYCYEDFEVLEKILGPTIVHRASHRVDASLFELDRHAVLVQALLSAFDGITATREAVAAEAETAEEPADDEAHDDLGAPS
jgi:5-methylcytosine-specific restriction protein B